MIECVVLVTGHAEYLHRPVVRLAMPNLTSSLIEAKFYSRTPMNSSSSVGSC